MGQDVERQTMSAQLSKLYSGRILALAADIPHLGHLDAPDARVRERAPLCGSTVSVDLCMRDGRVAQFAQDVKACALGQAASAIVGAHVIGRSRDELMRAKDEMTAFLTAEGPIPTAPFEGFEVLLPARDFKNRHASILLSITATVNAVNEAAKKSDQT